ncbi:MAG: hypothetical protein VB861_21280 [Planctomycetaceae bacterium]
MLDLRSTMLSTRLLILAILTLGFLPLVGNSKAVAQVRDSAAEFQFPANPASWVNSRPFTREQLGGKVAVMVFFEEG